MQGTLSEMKAEFHLPSLGMVLDETVVQGRGSAHVQRPGDRKGLGAGDRVGRSLEKVQGRDILGSGSTAPPCC